MSKAFTFAVTLSLSEGLSDDEAIKEMTENIADALKHAAQETGLAPEKSDAFVTHINVQPEFLPEAAVDVPVIHL
jgi:hypothetical protein